MLPLYKFLIFGIICLSHFPLQGEGRYVLDPVNSESYTELGLTEKRPNEHSRHIEAASLKRVLQYYKSQDNPRVEESIESDSIEVNPSHRIPSYRIDLESKERETSTISSNTDGVPNSLEDEEEIFNDVQTGTTTAPNTSNSADPEEAEIETTTLFPVDKMEELGVLDSDQLKLVAQNHHDDTNDDIVEHREGVETVIELEEMETNKSTSTSSVPEQSAEQEKCDEGDVRQQNCNMCICIGGSFFCSKRTCTASDESGPAKAPQIKKKYPVVLSTDDSEQELDVETVMDHTTAKTTTTTTTTTTPKPECVGGVTKAIDCNQCVCSPTGKWACTKRSCIALTLREKASYSDGSFMNKTETLLENPYIDDDCNEQETRNWGCNSCVCFMHSWQCTDNKCPPTTAPPKTVAAEAAAAETCTTEHDIKSIDCNVCHCTGGLWVCTRNDCKKFGNQRYELQSRSKFRFRSSAEKYF